MGKENKKIKANNYTYPIFGACFTIIGIIVLIIFIITNQNNSTNLAIGCPIIGFFTIFATILTFLHKFDREWDFYDAKGIKRVQGSRIVFELRWSEIKTVNYETGGLAYHILLTPNRLALELKNILEYKPYSFSNLSSVKTIYCPMSKKKFEQIKHWIPFDINEVSK